MGQAPGTHWYHAHKHGSTTSNVMNGMTGLFIIEGDYDETIRKFYGANFKEKLMVLQQLGSVPSAVTGAPNLDSNFVVNGRYQPKLSMPGKSVMMWRIGNTAASAGAFFGPPDPGGLQWKQTAVDGVQLSPRNYMTRPNNFLLMSGNRIDLLVKAPAYKPNGGDEGNTYKVIVYSTFDPSDRPPQKPDAKPLTLLTVVVTADGPDMDFMTEEQAPKLPEFLRDITTDQLNGEPKTLRFQTVSRNTDPPKTPTGTNQMINDKLFDGSVGADGALNHSAEWTIKNEASKVSHPFHIHVNPFQLTEIFSPSAYINTGWVKARGGEMPLLAKASVTKDSPEVSGGFASDFGRWFRVGDIINIPGGQGGIIKEVKSASVLIMEKPATANVSDAVFTRLIPQYTIEKGDVREGQCYLDPGDKATWKPCKEVEPESETQRVWWDVFPIPSSQTFTTTASTKVAIPGYFKMRTRFADFPGFFVLHCHILGHEDLGMMTVVEVTPGTPPKKSPYEHH
jgi:FtsP/CotA-like multicopper oxidase with cupredoxin domain